MTERPHVNLEMPSELFLSKQTEMIREFAEFFFSNFGSAVGFQAKINKTVSKSNNEDNVFIKRKQKGTINTSKIRLTLIKVFKYVFM